MTIPFNRQRKEPANSVSIADVSGAHFALNGCLLSQVHHDQFLLDEVIHDDARMQSGGYVNTPGGGGTFIALTIDADDHCQPGRAFDRIPWILPSTGREQLDCRGTP